MNNTFYTTRPRLALYLIEKGFKAELTVNLWDPQKSAWKFQLTFDLAEEVTDYYQSRNMIPPKIIEQFMTQYYK